MEAKTDYSVVPSKKQLLCTLENVARVYRDESRWRFEWQKSEESKELIRELRFCNCSQTNFQKLFNNILLFLHKKNNDNATDTRLYKLLIPHLFSLVFVARAKKIKIDEFMQQLIERVVRRSEPAQLRAWCYPGGGLALHFFVRYGKQEMLSLLIDSGADLNKLDNDGYTPFYIAISKDFMNCAKIIYQHKTYKVNSDIYSAINVLDRRNENQFSAKLYIRASKINHGANIDSWPMSHRNDALLATARRGDRNLLKLLMDRGAKGSELIRSHTPLVLTIKGKHFDCAQEIYCHANFEIKHDWQIEIIYKAILAATLKNHNETVKGLLGKISGRTIRNEPIARHCQDSLDIALLSAAEQGNKTLAHLLMSHGADANAIFTGYTPLSMAIKNSHVDCAQVIYKNITFKTNVSCMDIAITEAKNSKNYEVMADLENKKNSKLIYIYIKKRDFATAMQICEQPTYIPDSSIYLAIQEANKQNQSKLAKRLYDKVIAAKLESDIDSWPMSHYHSALFVSARYGNQELVTWLMDRGVDASALNNEYLTPLSSAVICDNISCAKAIYQHKKYKPNSNIYQAILWTARSNNTEMVKNLFDKATEFNVANDINVWINAQSRNSTLHYVVRWNNVELVPLLMDHGADANALNGAKESSLYMAIRKGDFDCAKLMYNHKNYKPNGSTSDAINLALKLRQYDLAADLIILTGKDQKFPSALHQAVKLRSRTLIQLLMSRGADANELNDNYSRIFCDDKKCGVSRTALGLALSRGNTRCAKAIYQHDKYKPNIDIYEAILWAGFRDETEIAAALLRKAEAGKIENKINDYRFISSDKTSSFHQSSALHAAVWNNNQELVKFFMDHGADANMSSEFNDSPLYYAVRMGHIRCAKIIYRHKNYKPDSSIYPVIHQANEEGEQKVAEELLKIATEAKLEASMDSWSQQDRFCALFVAARRDNTELVKKAQSPHLVISLNLAGQSPLYLAVKNGHMTCARIMCQDIELKQYDKFYKIIDRAIKNEEYDVAADLSILADECFFKEGMDPSKYPDGVFLPALYRAVMANKLTLVNALMGKSADANLLEINKNAHMIFTALSWAISRGKFDFAKAIYQHPNYKPNKNIYAALLSSAALKSTDIFIELLEIVKEVEDEIKSNDWLFDGVHVLHAAVTNKNLWLVKLLVQRYQVNVNIKDPKGDTPLHIAAANGYAEMVQYLLNHQADLSLKNKAGKKPSELPTTNKKIQSLLSNAVKSKITPELTFTTVDDPYKELVPTTGNIQLKKSDDSDNDFDVFAV